MWFWVISNATPDKILVTMWKPAQEEELAKTGILVLLAAGWTYLEIPFGYQFKHLEKSGKIAPKILANSNTLPWVFLQEQEANIKTNLSFISFLRCLSNPFV